MDERTNLSLNKQLFLDELRARFGEDDVCVDYSSSEYPFGCDLYVKSRDLYIELFMSFLHKDSTESAGSLMGYAKAAVLRLDGRKLACAKEQGLNYVVFRDPYLRDVCVWLSMNCPDGRDYDKDYSWLPERDVSVPENFTGQLKGTVDNVIKIVKSYQHNVIYEREIKLWNENLEHRGLPVQMFLYHNRLKYVNKLPSQLTNKELMRGFTISGVLRGYTSFNISLMSAVVEKYGIKSIYDPCAGWGERILFCKAHGIKYLGIDINEKLKPGYDRMRYDFDMTDQWVVFADSACCSIPRSYDTVVTCPPYGSVEIYSKKGAENLSDEEFLSWWGRVVKNSLTGNMKLFCFQVNKKWRDRMLQVVLDHGFVLEDELTSEFTRSSHFTRGKNGVNYKKEGESMLVCRRI